MCCDRIIYCWYCTVDALIRLHSDVSSLAWVGGSGVVEEALKICPAGTSSDHAEAMLPGEWGGELRAPGVCLLRVWAG